MFSFTAFSATPFSSATPPGLTFLTDVAETATAALTATAAATFGVATTDSSASADEIFAGAVFTPLTSEVASASDSPSSLYSVNAAVDETIQALDQPASSATFGVATSTSASISALSSVSVTFAVSTSEAASVSEVPPTASVVFAANIAELAQGQTVSLAQFVWDNLVPGQAGDWQIIFGADITVGGEVSGGIAAGAFASGPFAGITGGSEVILRRDEWNLISPVQADGWTEIEI